MSETPPSSRTSPDAERYTFTDHGPWVIDRDALQWTTGIAALRAGTGRLVPQLVRRHAIPPTKRLVVVSWALGKALAGWVLFDRWRGKERSTAGLSRRLRIAAEQLGPTFIKLAQIISSGEGLFPAALTDEFKKCRDQVPPEPFETVRRVVEDDLGAPLTEVFSWFDPVPLAAASIAQVHRATLLTGEDVVVKVQRPPIRHLVFDDIAVMAWIAPLLVGRIPVAALANPPALVELFAETIVEELDFRLEAENMLDVAEIFAQLSQRGFVVARPHPKYVTRRVLVMERLSGFAWEDVEGIADAGISGHDLIRTGMVGFTEGSLIHGIFHGDLHGGNLFALSDGRIALLDFGITARMTEAERTAFLMLMVTSAMGDIRGELTAFRDLGALPADTDLDWVIRELGLDQAPIDPTAMSQEELIAEIRRVTTALLGMGARLPKILMLYIKNLVFLDGAIATHAPDLDILTEVMNLWTTIAEKHGEKLAATTGIAPGTAAPDATAVRAAFGVVDEESPLTHEELRRRRELIRHRMAKR